MSRNSKYTYLYVLQGHYGDSWEDLAAAEDYRDVRANLREYRENEGGWYRIIQRRELNPRAHDRDQSEASLSAALRRAAKRAFGYNNERETTMKQITEHEVIVHGVEHEQYFQGCGVSFTSYTDVATGIGADARQAFDDALESLAQGDWDVEAIATETDDNGDNERGRLPDVKLPNDAHDEMWVYVSVRVR